MKPELLKALYDLNEARRSINEVGRYLVSTADSEPPVVDDDGNRPPDDPPVDDPPADRPPPREPPPDSPPPPDGPPPPPPPPVGEQWSLAQIEALRTVDRSGWQVIGGNPNTDDGIDGFDWEGPRLLEKFVGLGSFRSFAVIGGNRPDPTPPIGYTWQDFEGRPLGMQPGQAVRSNGQDHFGRMIWWRRAYNFEHMKILRGWIHQVYKEHGIYESPGGSLELGYLLIEDCGGQAIQVASRPFHSDGSPKENNAFDGGDMIHIHDVLAKNCGHEKYGASGGGGSFPISIAFHWQGPGEAQGFHLADVLIDNVFVHTDHVVDGEGNPDAKGAILCDASGNHWRYGEVTIRPAEIKLNRNSREVMKLGGARLLRVFFPPVYEIEGKSHVEIDKGNGKPCGRVEWKGSPAGAGIAVRQHGNQIATADEDFTLVNGVKQ